MGALKPVPLLLVLRKHLQSNYWSVQFFIFFLCFSLVTINPSSRIIRGFTGKLHRPTILAIGQKFGGYPIFNPTFICLRKHLVIHVIGQFSFLFSVFFSAFHRSPSIGRPRINPVSFVKTMESYENSLSPRTTPD